MGGYHIHIYSTIIFCTKCVLKQWAGVWSELGSLPPPCAGDGACHCRRLLKGLMSGRGRSVHDCLPRVPKEGGFAHAYQYQVATLQPLKLSDGSRSRVQSRPSQSASPNDLPALGATSRAPGMLLGFLRGTRSLPPFEVVRTEHASNAAGPLALAALAPRCSLRAVRPAQTNVLWLRGSELEEQDCPCHVLPVEPLRTLPQLRTPYDAWA